jgi:hypothetical protein
VGWWLVWDVWEGGGKKDARIFPLDVDCDQTFELQVYKAIGKERRYGRGGRIRMCI